jgi:hypothetical protein
MASTPPPGLGHLSPIGSGMRRNDSSASVASMASEPATSGETAMAACLKVGDYAGVLAGLQSAEKVNHRMVNMAFTANIESGRSVESAAVEMLQSCAKHNIKNVVALYGAGDLTRAPVRDSHGPTAV